MKLAMSLPQFEAELNTDRCDSDTNAELTLTLKLGFRQINPAAGAAEAAYHDYGDPNETTRRIVKWTAGSWNLWKRNFVASAARFWNGKFWLSNNFPLYECEKNPLGIWVQHNPAGIRPWDGKSWLPAGFRADDSTTLRYRPNIWCLLKIEDRDIRLGGHHHVIDVVRLHKSETWFGSHAKLYDSLDIKSTEKGTNSKGKPIMQRAHVHEIGHLLGLAHVDVGKPHCPPGGNTNAANCYGVADVDKYSVMGQGMQLRLSHAMPWRKAMVALSGKGNALVAGDWEAKLQKIYPRLPAEVATNAMLTTRPNRK